ncbi:hypothetical protein [Lederbergia citrea]|uniref:hypothetical protein n=1 Tax=Lederbergia citrea TaxID=2833581 RepID=UPI001BC967D8|nr:hypothetical protein [Lederbergia citrea]MBS4176756.1 hypothetical protein [Lederbergia citrea]
MVYRRVLKYIFVLIFISFFIFICPPNFLAKDSKQEAFLKFEKQIYYLIDSSMEPLNQLSEDQDGESLYHAALATKQKFADNSLVFTKLRVPSALPNDIKTSLEHTKEEILTGFKALEESMDYFAQYIVNREPILYERFIEKRDKGFLYIDGGLTSLATVRLQLDAPKIRSIPNAWKVGRRQFYQLEKNFLQNDKAVPIKSEHR